MLRLCDIMTRNVITATPEMTLREAAEQFAAHHISGAPVVHGRRVVGVVSAADIVAYAASTRVGVSTGGASPEVSPPASYFTQLWSSASDDIPDGVTETDVLDAHTVEEIMTRPLVTVGPNDDILHAATLMEQKAIHRVIVVDRGELVGIVSTLDIVRAVADRMLPARA